MKADAIIQARWGATRLPGKVLLKVRERTILEYVIERAQKAANISSVVLATTTGSADDALFALARSLGVKVFRGSEQDVLDRYYQAAKSFHVSHIVRITADCPLIDPAVIDKVVARYFETGVDYCSNILTPTYPDGQDVEVFGFPTLEKAWKEATLSSEREHVTPYIWKNPKLFKLTDVRHGTDLSQKRWTLDKDKDFEFIKIILEHFYPGRDDYHMEDVLDFLKRNPHLEEINKDTMRNEGYMKSLKEDKKIK